MLSLVLFFTFGGAALAQDVDPLVSAETEGGVPELLEEIQKRDAALAAKDKEIAELRAVSGTKAEALPVDDALALRDAALNARDEALQKLEAVSKDMAARIRASELAAAALEEHRCEPDGRLGRARKGF